MLTTTAIQKAYLFATGKTTTLTSTSKKYIKLLDLLDSAQQDWFTEPGIVWNSRRVMATLDSTVTATNTFELLDSETGDPVRYISDFEGDPVVITHTDGSTTEYTTVPPEQLSLHSGTNSVCSIYGGNIVFPTAFTATSAQFGGTISVPHYQTPETLTGAVDEELVVDNPLFACYVAAAQYVRPDLVLGAQYGNLVAMAAPLMQRMKEENVSQDESSYVSNFAQFSGQTWD